jgi:UDP-N-acetyl-D-glucosamine/UDP-N-acetyl-D-galactosamine dehydrogenase
VNTNIAIVGLGYVGLPLSVALGSRFKTIGYDVDEQRLAQYQAGSDPFGSVSNDELLAASQLEFTADPCRLNEADMIIIVVPTPIDEARRPDLGPLRQACITVGKNMRAGTTVVFESTVYPGCTEEVCVPILERESGLAWLDPEGFYVAYSPERVNPGDKAHSLQNVTKVISGDCEKTVKKIAAVYGEIIDAGLHHADSIKVAEASKVIENTQRDLNIALMNELALIFNRMDIDTLDVLEAAGTKWNFLPFRPGLVGGHCIGVDPYYLTYKAEAEGHDAQVILAGRHINDNMGKFIAEQTVKQILKQGQDIHGSKVVILGLTFKEDCADIRNTRVSDIIDELRDYHCDVVVHDPMADPKEVSREQGIELTAWDELPAANAVILAVPHQFYRDLELTQFASTMTPKAVLIDVKSIIDRDAAREADITLWRL